MEAGTTTQQAQGTSGPTPRQAEAVAVYDRLRGQGMKGTGAEVAEVMGITAGRAGNYVREGLRAMGRTAEVRSGGGGGRRAASVPQTADQGIETLIAQAEGTLERLDGRIGEAREAAATFDAKAWHAAQVQRAEEAVAQAQARVQALKDLSPADRKAQAEAEAERLQAQVAQVEGEVAEQRDTVQATIGKLRDALEAVS